MPAPLSISLDTKRKKKKAGTYPVILLVVKDSKPKRYRTIYDLTQADNQKLSAHPVSEELRKVRNELKEISHAAEQAVNEIQSFTLEAFERHLFIPIHSLNLESKSNLLIYPTTKNLISANEKNLPILKEKHPSPDAISAVFVWHIKLMSSHFFHGLRSSFVWAVSASYAWSCNPQ
jgi:hypothetical protein